MMKNDALLYENYKDNILHCFLCSHHCKIADGKIGFCGVRQNIGGALYTLVYGDIIARHVDPIEKKPLYHFLPGSHSYSIATIGCNFRCGFCQNWQISQARKKDRISSGSFTSPEKVVEEALANACCSISYTYTEPTIYFEYAYDISRLAAKAGLYNVFVTNGYMTRECIETIHPYLHAANIDLKSFRNDFYTKICKGTLQPVLDSIRLMRKRDIWVEVTTLLIPDQNDSDEELNNIASFLAETGREIPWHISAFHPEFRFETSAPTPIETLRRAREIGLHHGLRYVYMGNVQEGSDTYCYNCHHLLIHRKHFTVEKINMNNGACAACSAPIDGVWK